MSACIVSPCCATPPWFSTRDILGSLSHCSLRCHPRIYIKELSISKPLSRAKVALAASSMSASLDGLPTRPQNVLPRNSPYRFVKATGFEPRDWSQQTSIRNRQQRPRAMHDITPGPPDNELFAYFKKKAKKIDNASCVFLLWGSRDSERSPTCAVDVETTDLEDEGDIFQKLADRYFAERGLLKRCFSFREFEKLEPVTVCFIPAPIVPVHTNAALSSE